jgi:hypothetical protein
MSKFSTLPEPTIAEKRLKYERSYNNARANLIWVIAFTIINIFLLAINADVYFLFSAFIPYFIVSVGMLICGRFPAEYYVDELEGMTFLNNSVFVVLLIIAVALSFVYLLAFLMSSKNRVGWLVFALVFFGIDTLAMLFLGGISVETILDVIFHGWCIVSLILGIVSHYKLKELPESEESFNVDSLSVSENIGENVGENVEENIEANVESDVTDSERKSAAEDGPKNSNIIRPADKNVKHRIFLQKHIFSYDICYRRVKHTNELVINGNVYDEIEGIMEYPHSLKAFIDGHYIVVGFDGLRSYINVDGDNVAKKIRLY